MVVVAGAMARSKRSRNFFGQGGFDVAQHFGGIVTGRECGDFDEGGVDGVDAGAGHEADEEAGIFSSVFIRVRPWLMFVVIR